MYVSQGSRHSVVIMGAGPAGLTAAYELGKNGVTATILERDAVVGGLARTGCHKGNHFDLGGHRFYTKLRVVEQLWRGGLGQDLLTRQRLWRIYYDSKFFRYPIEPLHPASSLGVSAAR